MRLSTAMPTSPQRREPAGRGPARSRFAKSAARHREPRLSLGMLTCLVVVGACPLAASAAPAAATTTPAATAPAAITRRAPRLGEHTEEILSELGLSRAEIASLRERKIV